MSEAFGHQTVRARKRHLCDACWMPISPQTVYARWCWADGTVVTCRAHLGCLYIMEQADRLGMDCGLPRNCYEVLECARVVAEHEAIHGTGPQPSAAPPDLRPLSEDGRVRRAA